MKWLLFLAFLALPILNSKATKESNDRLLTECIGDTKFAFLLQTAFSQMDAKKAGKRLEWLPGVPNVEMMFGLSQQDLDIFFEFVAQVNDVAKSFRKRYSKLPRNGTSPIILKKPTTTPAPPSTSSFLAAPFMVIFLVFLALTASAGGYFLWKRYNGHTRSIIDFLPLIRNGADGSNENYHS